MQNRKIYVVLIICILVFFAVMFLSFSLPNILKNRFQTTLIVGNHTVLSYRDQKWNLITDWKEKQELNWKKFQVYMDNEKKGEYYLWHDDKWYAFDDEKNSIPMVDNFLAYDANYDVSVLPFKEEKIQNTMYVANVLKKYHISLSSKLTNATLVSVDFDHDGIVEDFYAVSNAFSLENEPETVFTFAFMVKNETIYMIYEDVRTEDYFGACKPFFTSFLDADNDQNYELIFSCGRYSVEEQLDVLYEFSKESFKKVISNE